jgi:AraC-like DNA-binding protein
MSDTLSDVLGAVRLRGALFFTIDATAPWAVEAPRSCEITSSLIPGAEHLIEFHVMRRGRCWAGVVGEPPVHMEAGDVVLFPQGDTHVLSSAPGMRGTPDPDAYDFAGRPVPVTVNVRGGGEPAELICGFFGCDARPFNPLLATLPRTIHIRSRDRDDGTIPQLVRLALTELAERRSGRESVLSHVSELLFVEAVRRYLETLPAEQKGWLAGLADEQVGRAIAKLHERPAHPWSLEELAREAGLSRSTLAERFAQFVGVPPMQYLAQWRIQLAASLLSGTALGLAELAARVGYGSEAALSRAFKRQVGVSPALWRQGKRTKDAG